MTNIILPGEIIHQIQGENNKDAIQFGSGVVLRNNALYCSIGGILKKREQNFWMDIGSSKVGMLDGFSFEGSSRKNRPDLKPGAVVYCRVAKCSRDMEPELSCVNAKGKAEGLGLLPGGFIFSCSSFAVKEWLSPSCVVLLLLGEFFSFEMAIGLNGKVWVTSPSNAITIFIVQLLQDSLHLSDSECRDKIDQFVLSSNK